MADNVAGFNHLDASLMNLGDQFRKEAIMKQMAEAKGVKGMGAGKTGTADAALERLAYQREKDQADRLEAGYAATYNGIMKANPHLTPQQAQQQALKLMQLTPQQAAGFGKFYGKTPYNLPASATANFMQPGQSGPEAQGVTPDVE